MSISQSTRHHGSFRRTVAIAAICVAAVFGGAVPALGLDLEGFMEPYRTINIAAEETGIIDSMLVREGDKVVVGQPVARLNSEVHLALLAIAEQNMRAEGRLDAANAELSLRRDRLAKLKTLLLDGHARQEEILRAEAEVAVAEANVRTAREDLLTRKLEHGKLKIQYERRTVRTPVAGVVTMLHRQPGEFVAPNKPDVVTLVDLESLLANFTVMGPQADKLHVGDKVSIYLAGNVSTEGVVEFVAPVTDAESGTVRVKIRIENSAGRFRSGERCKIRL